MDPLTDDRGQSLLVVVLAIAIAIVAVAGLRTAQERVVASARVNRAGEAAVEAAAGSLADVYAAHISGTRFSGQPSPSNVVRLMSEPRVVDAARAAAADLARENGAVWGDRLDVTCSGGRVEAQLWLAGRLHRAGFLAPECSRP